MKDNYIIAIDPGNIESAFCVINDKTYKPVEFGKVNNDDLIVHIATLIEKYDVYAVAIEMIASYGMPVGKEVFDTCVWIGRYYQRCITMVGDIDFIYRKEEKMNLCGSMKAKDSNIRQALIDRFATFDFKNGKGVKKNPDFFYGFSKDVWAAFAVGCTYLDKIKEQE